MVAKVTICFTCFTFNLLLLLNYITIVLLSDMDEAAKLGARKSDTPIKRYSSLQLRKLNQLGTLDDRSLAKIKRYSLLHSNINLNYMACGIQSVPPSPSPISKQ